MDIMYQSEDLNIVEFDPSDSDEVIRRFINRHANNPNGRICMWRICMSSFDNDKRELIEIPEARQFARRLIDLGLLPMLELPMPDGSYIMQTDAPGLNGLALHAISNGAGQVRRRGKRVHIGMDIDAVGYFTDMLKSFKEQDAPESMLRAIERIIENQSKFDPLRGSSKFIADEAMDEFMKQNDDKWPSRLKEGTRHLG